HDAVLQRNSAAKQLSFEQVGHRSPFEWISAEGYSSVVISIYKPFGQWSADEDHQATTGLAGRACAGRPFGALEGGHPLCAAGWPATHMRAGKAHCRHLAESVD